MYVYTQEERVNQQRVGEAWGVVWGGASSISAGDEGVGAAREVDPVIHQAAVTPIL